MPVELGSFDAIIVMDWMVKYHAIIVYAEKIIRIPWGNETLIVHGDGSNRGHEARLHIISYTKKQEYMLKGCPVFLVNVNTKETEDKSEKKRLEDVPNVWDFPDVFPEDFLGLHSTRQVEFQIDLIPRAAFVARAPYRLAPSENDKCYRESCWVLSEIHRRISKGLSNMTSSLREGQVCVAGWTIQETAFQLLKNRSCVCANSGCNLEGSKTILSFIAMLKSRFGHVLMAKREGECFIASHQLIFMKKIYTNNDLEMERLVFSLKNAGETIVLEPSVLVFHGIKESHNNIL
ncbi:hypothetical protein Tco_0477881 [Tanacetum coccineum]